MIGAMGRVSLSSLSFALLVLTASCGAQQLIANTTDGPVEGIDCGYGVECFLGIPYATAQRFEEPIRLTPRREMFFATKFSDGCPQNCTIPGFLCPATISEDCLTINVWSPRGSRAPSAALLPAYVFIHGGSFEFGSAGIPFFNASRLAATQDMVVFTFNYRLGVLGFFQCTNLGIKDQTLALQWIRDNAAQFGADPSAVTLAGESAGAYSVFLHLTLPSSVGLFSRAVVESHILRVPMRTPQVSGKWSSTWCAKAGCGSGCAAACIRNASLSTVIGAQDETMVYSLDVTSMILSWLPCVDVSFVPMQMYESMYAPGGMRSQVPLIIGTNEGEGWMFISALFPNKPPLPVELDAILTASFGFKIGQHVLAAYPDPDTSTALAKIITDWLFYCPSRTAARVLSEHLVPVHTNAPVWMYRFNHTLSVDPWGPHYHDCAANVCHGVELAFVFCSAAVLGYNITADEEALCGRVQSAWGAFVHGRDGDMWPQYNATAALLHEWSTPSDMTLQHVQMDVCQGLWDTVPY